MKGKNLLFRVLTTVVIILAFLSCEKYTVTTKLVNFEFKNATTSEYHMYLKGYEKIGPGNKISSGGIRSFSQQMKALDSESKETGVGGTNITIDVGVGQNGQEIKAKSVTYGCSNWKDNKLIKVIWDGEFIGIVEGN